MRLDIEKEIKILREEYDKARLQSHIRNPVAYALHQTWRFADSCADWNAHRELNND